MRLQNEQLHLRPRETIYEEKIEKKEKSGLKKGPARSTKHEASGCYLYVREELRAEHNLSVSLAVGTE